MAVAENGGVKEGVAASQNFDATLASSEANGGSNTAESTKPMNESLVGGANSQSQSDDRGAIVGKCDQEDHTDEMAAAADGLTAGEKGGAQMGNGFDGGYGGSGENQMNFGKSNGSNEMRELVEMLSKLNPMAQEFVPPSLVNNHGNVFGNGGFKNPNNFGMLNPNGNPNGMIKRKNNFNQGRRRTNGGRRSMAQREEVIRRTVYVSDIDQQVTEEQLAGLFLHCGQVVDCRICGDPNSVLRFAFIEFTDEEGARAAITLSGTVLGYYPLRVLPSKTAIAPVNPTFLPRSEDEREMCARTVYCTNIDKKITPGDVRLFFESFCGEVQCLRLLGDYHHSTRIAFVEFAMAESAIAALNCSGALLGTLPIRVSPSKTPVRPRFPRPPPLH
ncbi:unnamed protein product [Linum tenue]|uniref:RRM domain-containing protein n=1 Tax=Linum tenue TaxID=586396 RepID=A0AAV0IJA0_9ROSI|nr:unnamed protein product [Linum tenue]